MTDDCKLQIDHCKFAMCTSHFAICSRLRWTLVAAALCALGGTALAQAPAVTVATIDGEAVYAAEVERELAAAYPNRKLEDDERRVLLAGP